ncbi:DUF6011 domain-containing protein [Nocardioides cheoyonin]|uniref:DUF6011 domain-containing protein n=1 Tax=Nocardioides cheoyonin TaxID=3156615 RepID=UPI003CCC69FA
MGRTAERRPPGEDRRSEVDNHDDAADSTDARCWICGHALTARESVALGIGPRCWSRRMGGAA